VVFPDRDDRRREQRERGDRRNSDAHPDLVSHLGTEHVQRHAGDAERSRLDDRHRVQQPGDRRRRDHRNREPLVQRHQASFDAESDSEEQIRDLNDRFVRVRDLGETLDAAGCERDRPGEPEDEDGPRQHEHAAAEHSVGEVLPAGRARLVSFVVGDERVRRHRKQLVKQEDRHEIAGEGDPHRRRQRGRKGGEVPSLAVLVQPAHVPDAVKRRDDPQQAREGRK